MRTIKFRGKRLDNGEWVYGSLLVWPDRDCYILSHEAGDLSFEMTKVKVDPETVGQYTGLKDKKKKEIYEGGILHVMTDFGEALNRVVYYLSSSFCIYIQDETDVKSIVYAVEACDAEIIGNIHDNPELIESNEPQ